MSWAFPVAWRLSREAQLIEKTKFTHRVGFITRHEKSGCSRQTAPRFYYTFTLHGNITYYGTFGQCTKRREAILPANPLPWHSAVYQMFRADFPYSFCAPFPRRQFPQSLAMKRRYRGRPLYVRAMFRG